MKKIIVPCDFSSTAQEAFKFAVKIATQSKGEIDVVYMLDITLLHGAPTLSHSYAINLNFIQDMKKEAEARFKAMWEKYSPRTLPVKFRHNIGSLLPDIETYIRENGIDLVVMGTDEGHGAAWESNADRIIRHAAVPVFAIRKDPARAIRNIVVPVIPEHPDAHFCDEVKKLQDFFQAGISLLWINTPRIFKTDSRAHASLRKFAIDNTFRNYSLHIRSDYTIEDGICRFAKETDADMIAMGTHAWKGLVHFFTGSIAEDLVNHVDLPVWTVSLGQRPHVTAPVQQPNEGKAQENETVSL